MRIAVSLMLMLLSLAAAPASAKEKLILDAADTNSDALRGAKIEIWRVESSGERQLAQKDSADKAHRGEVELADGAYEIYLEDPRTGLIYRQNNQGKGFKIGKGKPVRVDTAEFVQRVREIKEKDKQERSAKIEALKQYKGKRSVLAVERPAGDPAADSSIAPEVHAPGELLVKFQPATTLADRYRLMQEIEAESRSKIQALDVYRVKLSDHADLPAIISTYADDPRLKYMEMNMVVSVPEPVEGR